MNRRVVLPGAAIGLMVMLAGCAAPTVIVSKPRLNVDHALPPGQWGLSLLRPSQYPNMEAAFMHKAGLLTAIDRSMAYLQSPSSRKFFPDGPITHRQELNTLYDFRTMLRTFRSPGEFQQAILQRYDVYTARGYDDRGSVWFTGYYTPILYGSLVRTGPYQYPVYKAPRDLVANPVTGQILGQRLPNGTIRPYPTRRQIVEGHLLQGRELVWFSNPLDAYVAEIQGSAKVILTNHQVMTIGYAGDNGRTYSGLGVALVKSGAIRRRKLSLPAIESYFHWHPKTVERLILKNHFMAFLKPYNPAHWPLGSLGVKVTPHRSLATDKTIEAPPYQSIFPRAAITFVSTQVPDLTGHQQPFTGFLLDQDTGGAIRAAGRADIYMGIGPEAENQAGYELSKGRLYYLFLKPGLTPLGGPGAAPTLPAPVNTAPGRGGAPAAAGPSTTAPKSSSNAMQQMFPGAK